MFSLFQSLFSITFIAVHYGAFFAFSAPPLHFNGAPDTLFHPSVPRHASLPGHWHRFFAFSAPPRIFNGALSPLFHFQCPATSINRTPTTHWTPKVQQEKSPVGLYIFKLKKAQQEKSPVGLYTFYLISC